MKYAGFFVNLDRDGERRAKMELQLATMGLTEVYQRFPAAEGNARNFPNPHIKNGEIGAFTSYYLLLKENLGRRLPLHIIEDDILLARCMTPTIHSIIDAGLFETYDIIYTDTQIPTSNVYYKTYKTLFDKITKRDAAGKVTEATFQLVALRDGKFGTASSLLIGPRSIAKLHDLYEAELRSGAQLPVDLFVWREVTRGTLKAACLFPFITSLRLEHSIETTLAERYDQLSILARDIARVSFFVDRDLNLIRDYLNKYVPLADDPHLQILMHILGFSFTDKFVDI